MVSFVPLDLIATAGLATDHLMTEVGQPG